MAKSKTKSKSKIYFSLAKVLTFLILSAIVIGCGFVYKPQIESLFGGKEISSNQNSIDYDGLVVHYIDVGQADCIFIELPDGKTMLIDAGDTDGTEQMTTYIDDNIFNRITDKKIDYCLLTHSDSDHCGGMATIFAKYQVNNAFRPQIYVNETDKLKDENSPAEVEYKNTIVYSKTISSMYNEPNCNVYFTTATLMNTSQKICGASGDDYYEFYFYTPTKNSYKKVNDYSPIMTLTYKGKVLMFTGDATTTVESEALEQTLPKVDVLKVGHHGSTTSSGKTFLKKILPTYSVIQVGKDNSYGHPKQVILQRLNEINSQVYRTDENGTVIANVSQNGNLIILCVKASKFNVIYLIIGLELVLVYFCFAVRYNSSNKTDNNTTVLEVNDNMSQSKSVKNSTKKSTKTTTKKNKKKTSKITLKSNFWLIQLSSKFYY